MKSNKANDLAIAAWTNYVDSKVPMVIYPTPKGFPISNPYILVPRDNLTFVINYFDSIEAGRKWGAQHGIEVSEGFKARQPIGMLIETGEGILTAYAEGKGGVSDRFIGTVGRTLDGSVSVLFNLTEKPATYTKNYFVIERLNLPGALN